MYHSEIQAYLISCLESKQIKHKWDKFASGCEMIDIWHNDEFYVVQIEPDFVGFSHVTDETDPFSVVPDLKFVDLEKFKVYFEQTFS